ncbi:MAG: type III pantothenate kinase [Bacteroidota bacterium]
MHNLVIDIGNTNSKLAVFNNKELIHYKRLTTLSLNSLKEVVEAYKLQYFTISSVDTAITDWIDFLKNYATYIPFSAAITGGIINKYETLHSLGSDRWAKVIAAHRLYPGKNCLAIDAGTCITYDMLSAKSEYNGGSISLGINMRFEALHHYTGKLPLVKWDKKEPIVAGTNTINAITNGVLQGVINEIEGFIALENKKYKALTVLLTGGDADFLIEQLKNSIFAGQITHHPYLVLNGLNEAITL